MEREFASIPPTSLNQKRRSFLDAPQSKTRRMPNHAFSNARTRAVLSRITRRTSTLLPGGAATCGYPQFSYFPRCCLQHRELYHTFLEGVNGMKKILEFCKMLFCGRAVSVDVGLPKSLRVELLAGRNPGKGTHCYHKPAYLADWKPGQNYEKGHPKLWTFFKTTLPTSKKMVRYPATPPPDARTNRRA